MSNGMIQQPLRDWVHRSNDLGVAGLGSRTSPGRPRRLTPVRMEEFRAMVVTRPSRPSDREAVRFGHLAR